MFVHEDPEFDDLLRIVGDQRRLGVGLVEKDYWVTHTLWALLDQGFELWFKGGTSLSKGFGIIQRFSEDLDVRVDPGTVAALPAVANWTGQGRPAVAQRRAHFEQLASKLLVPGAEVALDEESSDGLWRNAGLRVVYPGKHLADLDPMRPFVLLEVGNARVTPYVERDLSSFVHEHLIATGQLSSYDQNKPYSVRVVHPLVTLVEKLDALQRRVGQEDREPASFVRHFEDAARIIDAEMTLPPLDGYDGPRSLADEMLAEGQIRAMPSAKHPAFTPDDSPRWDSIRSAYEAIAPMYWGPRLELDVACSTIRHWIARVLGEASSL